MAKLLPENVDHSISSGEKFFLQALSKYTPDTWIAYHNFNFLEFDNNTKPIRSKKLHQGEADVVLFIPEFGFIVIEVKGGGIEFYNNHWVSIDRYGDYHQIKNPFEQARKAQHFIKNTCRKVTNDNFVSGYAVCFPDINDVLSVDLPVESPRQIILTKQIINSIALEKTILTIFKYWHPVSSLTPSASKLIQHKVLQPSFRLLPTLSDQFNQNKKKLIQLTQQQYQILDFIEHQNHAIIEGGAGTGKTLLLIEKARRLSEANNKVLILTFNIKIADLLKNIFSQNKKVSVNTIHGLSEELCKLSKIEYKIPEAVEEIGKFYNETSIELLNQSAENLNLSYDAILVDEAQDFEDHWWIPITELLTDETPNKSWLYIFHDPNQNIFKRDFNFPVESSYRFKLTYNCRNSLKIAKWLNSHFKYSALANPMSPEGEIVEIIRWKNKKEQNQKVKALLNKLEQNGVEEKEIVILTPFKPENSELEIPRSIEFDSIMKFKGLEKSVVIVADLKLDNAFCIREDLIYTAATRAISKLFLLVNKGILPDYLHL